MLALVFLALVAAEDRREFYSILELNNDCTEREIDKAYRVLSRKYHPDKNKGKSEAAAIYNSINGAYATLKDPQKRRIYDLFGDWGLGIYETKKNDMAVMLGLPEDRVIDAEEANVLRSGKKFRVVIPIDLGDLMDSGHYDLVVARRIMCRCPEQGYMCPKCGGRPTIREMVNMSFTIDKGAEEGTVLSLANIGDECEKNGAGDMEVEIVTRSHPIFERVGSDLHSEMNISLKEALLGFTRTVTGLAGQTFEVSSDGPLKGNMTIRVPDQGLPLHLVPGKFGDAVIHARVQWPMHLTDAQKNRLSALNCF